MNFDPSLSAKQGLESIIDNYGKLLEEKQQAAVEAEHKLAAMDIACTEADSAVIQSAAEEEKLAETQQKIIEMHHAIMLNEAEAQIAFELTQDINKRGKNQPEDAVYCEMLRKVQDVLPLVPGTGKKDLQRKHTAIESCEKQLEKEDLIRSIAKMETLLALVKQARANEEKIDAENRLNIMKAEAEACMTQEDLAAKLNGCFTSGDQLKTISDSYEENLVLLSQLAGSSFIPDEVQQRAENKIQLAYADSLAFEQSLADARISADISEKKHQEALHELELATAALERSNAANRLFEDDVHTVENITAAEFDRIRAEDDTAREATENNIARLDSLLKKTQVRIDKLNTQQDQFNQHLAEENEKKVNLRTGIEKGNVSRKQLKYMQDNATPYAISQGTALAEVEQALVSLEKELAKAEKELRFTEQHINKLISGFSENEIRLQRENQAAELIRDRLASADQQKEQLADTLRNREAIAEEICRELNTEARDKAAGQNQKHYQVFEYQQNAKQAEEAARKAKDAAALAISNKLAFQKDHQPEHELVVDEIRNDIQQATSTKKQQISDCEDKNRRLLADSMAQKNAIQSILDDIKQEASAPAALESITAPVILEATEKMCAARQQTAQAVNRCKEYIPLLKEKLENAGQKNLAKKDRSFESKLNEAAAMISAFLTEADSASQTDIVYEARLPEIKLPAAEELDLNYIPETDPRMEEIIAGLREAEEDSFVDQLNKKYFDNYQKQISGLGDRSPRPEETPSNAPAVVIPSEIIDEEQHRRDTAAAAKEAFAALAAQRNVSQAVPPVEDLLADIDENNFDYSVPEIDINDYLQNDPEPEIAEIIEQPAPEVEEIVAEPAVEEQPAPEAEEIVAEPAVQEQPAPEVEEIAEKPAVEEQPAPEIEEIAEKPAVQEQPAPEIEEIAEKPAVEEQPAPEVEEITEEPAVEEQPAPEAKETAAKGKTILKKPFFLGKHKNREHKPDKEKELANELDQLMAAASVSISVQEEAAPAEPMSEETHAADTAEAETKIPAEAVRESRVIAEEEARSDVENLAKMIESRRLEMATSAYDKRMAQEEELIREVEINAKKKAEEERFRLAMEESEHIRREEEQAQRIAEEEAAIKADINRIHLKNSEDMAREAIAKIDEEDKARNAEKSQKDDQEAASENEEKGISAAEQESIDIENELRRLILSDLGSGKY